ncbi:MAG: corrinoid protein [Desulfobacterales bacterium]|uniref:Corrinoid protein n=1 Tax=Candidatus Desulfatibia profunda TaxID=2841695 RepID=A0A8J6NT85_9BACT|nr:corrinoid protein [Candidatus Desulfatibia profunda]MBL7179640.1 corrinoid protein [Desulfobacterales bacterium]
MSILEEIKKNVFDGEENKTVELVKKALDEGQTPEDILDAGLVAGLRDCGKGFEKGEKFIPEMLMSSEAMKKAMVILKPLLLEGAGGGGFGKAVLATVEGDVHDIGLELVATMFETAGFEVRNMGPDVPTEDIVKAVKEDKPQIVGLSALLSNTMDVMPDVITALQKAGLRDSVKVMVGGAPVKQDFADEIGADGWAYDAASAVPKAKELRSQLP